MTWPLSYFQRHPKSGARAKNRIEKAAKRRSERDRKWLDRFFRRHADHDGRVLDPDSQRAIHLAQRLSIELEMEERVRQYNEDATRKPFDAAKTAAEQKRRGPETEPGSR